MERTRSSESTTLGACFAASRCVGSELRARLLRSWSRKRAKEMACARGNGLELGHIACKARALAGCAMMGSHKKLAELGRPLSLFGKALFVARSWRCTVQRHGTLHALRGVSKVICASENDVPRSERALEMI